jgi:hypothetical protein
MPRLLQLPLVLCKSSHGPRPTGARAAAARPPRSRPCQVPTPAAPTHPVPWRAQRMRAPPSPHRARSSSSPSASSRPGAARARGPPRLRWLLAAAEASLQGPLAAACGPSCSGAPQAGAPLRARHSNHTDTRTHSGHTPTQTHTHKPSHPPARRSVGVFWPSMMKMRSDYVPEELRATIINVFRIPLNLFVCIVLGNVRRGRAGGRRGARGRAHAARLAPCWRAAHPAAGVCDRIRRPARSRRAGRQPVRSGAATLLLTRPAPPTLPPTRSRPSPWRACLACAWPSWRCPWSASTAWTSCPRRAPCTTRRPAPTARAPRAVRRSRRGRRRREGRARPHGGRAAAAAAAAARAGGSWGRVEAASPPLQPRATRRAGHVSQRGSRARACRRRLRRWWGGALGRKALVPAGA